MIANSLVAAAMAYTTVSPLPTLLTDGGAPCMSLMCPGPENGSSPIDPTYCTVVVNTAGCVGPVATVAPGTTLSPFAPSPANVTSSPNSVTVTPTPGVSCTPIPTASLSISPTDTCLVTEEPAVTIYLSPSSADAFRSSFSDNPTTSIASSLLSLTTAQLQPSTSSPFISAGIMTSLSPLSVSSASIPSTTTTSTSSAAWTSTACVAFGVPDPVACPGGALNPSESSSPTSLPPSSSTTSANPAEPATSHLTSPSSASSTVSTTLSASWTAVSPALTSIPATASTSPANTTTPGPFVDHPYGRDHGHRHTAIAVPLAVGILILFLTAIFLWRRYHPSSFHTILDSIPGFGCFARWRKTREKNRQTRAIHRLGILTGDGRRFDGSGSVAGDTYARHLRKFEEDAARAKGRYSSDAGGQAPGSPFSTGNRSAKSGGTPRTPKLGSPWRYTPTKARSPRDMITPSSAESNRVYGSGRRTDSLQSWEETWYAMGTMGGREEEMGEEEMGEEEEAAGGPGQSWRKLV
ncbi:hypothetical protein CLAIMM_02899 [Cladophialophora immunda]|nr:hypothetical protein CLAIMM_02899 [Cladophialophora immunda]